MRPQVDKRATAFRSESQADLIARCRVESNIGDRSIRLGMMVSIPPLSGPSAHQYFAAKHAAGKTSRFHLWHTAIPLGWRERRVAE